MNCIKEKQVSEGQGRTFTAPQGQRVIPFVVFFTNNFLYKRKIK